MFTKTYLGNAHLNLMQSQSKKLLLLTKVDFAVLLPKLFEDINLVLCKSCLCSHSENLISGT